MRKKGTMVRKKQCYSGNEKIERFPAARSLFSGCFCTNERQVARFGLGCKEVLDHQTLTEQ